MDERITSPLPMVTTFPLLWQESYSGMNILAFLE